MNLTFGFAIVCSVLNFNAAILTAPKYKSTIEENSSASSTKKEKRGVFGFGVHAHGYAPHFDEWASNHHHNHHHPVPHPPIPPPHPSNPVNLGAHFHTTVTKKIGIPLPYPYPVKIPFPIYKPFPVDRPVPHFVPHPILINPPSVHHHHNGWLPSPPTHHRW